MAKLKQQNPTIDFGFYASVPRLVRTNYRDKVTPIMKWLYTCLKDLCGDDGTCYRTLRVLSEETGISTGLLSESIPILHEVGLIHAEKKKRSTGGKEVWHITIVDIWIANGKAHPTKRSQDEQTQASENVHNTNVHNVNETTGECSCGERECSQILDRRKNNLSKNNSEERKDISASDDDALPPKFQTLFDQMQKEIASLRAELSTKQGELPTGFTQDNQADAKANNEQASYSHPDTKNTPPSEPAQPANTKGNGRRTKKDATQDLTLQGAHVIELYEAFKKRKITRNPDNVKAANGLGESVASDTDFNEVLTVIANDKYLKDHNVRVDLDFVYRKYDGFFDVVVRLREKGQSSKPSQSNSAAISQITDPYVLATMRSAQRTLAAVN